MNPDEPRSLLHVCVHGRPVAILAAAGPRDYELTYLDGAKEEIAPNLPIRKEPYTFDRLPKFLGCLLPREGRALQVAKQLGFDADDTLARVRHCLATENVGHITITPAIETLAASKGGFAFDGLSAMAPTPVAITATSLKSLEDPEIQAALPHELSKKGGCTGAGGQFSKAFLRTPDGDYLLKHYPDFDSASGKQCAEMEAATMTAALACGLDAAPALAFGTILCSQRFDRPGAIKVTHLRELTGEDLLYGGSYEKAVSEISKIVPERQKEVVKQILFSWVVGDSDKHQENMAVLDHGAGGKCLAPIYDAMPCRYIMADTEEMALTIAGKKSKLGWKVLAPFAAKAGISANELSTFLTDAASAVRQHVLPVCPPAIQKMINTHLSIVEKTAGGQERGDIERELARGLIGKAVSDDVSVSTGVAVVR